MKKSTELLDTMRVVIEDLSQSLVTIFHNGFKAGKEDALKLRTGEPPEDVKLIVVKTSEGILTAKNVNGDRDASPFTWQLSNDKYSYYFWDDSWSWFDITHLLKDNKEG